LRFGSLDRKSSLVNNQLKKPHPPNDGQGFRASFYSSFQRRQAAFRTISGGICCGLTLLMLRLTQLPLLGYHLTLYSFTFQRCSYFVRFMSQPNKFILRTSSQNLLITLATTSLRRVAEAASVLSTRSGSYLTGIRQANLKVHTVLIISPFGMYFTDILLSFLKTGLYNIQTRFVIPAPAFAGVNLSPRKRGAGIQDIKNSVDQCLKTKTVSLST
jgi:hypothetical protein